MAEDSKFDRKAAELAFKRTFQAFARVLGEDSFRKYDPSKKKSSGAMLISLFEVLAIGLGHYAGDAKYDINDAHLKQMHAKLGSEARFNSAAGSGVRATTRLPVTVQLGRGYFAS